VIEVQEVHDDLRCGNDMPVNFEDLNSQQQVEMAEEANTTETVTLGVRQVDVSRILGEEEKVKSEEREYLRQKYAHVDYMNESILCRLNRRWEVPVVESFPHVFLQNRAVHKTHLLISISQLLHEFLESDVNQSVYRRGRHDWQRDSKTMNEVWADVQDDPTLVTSKWKFRITRVEKEMIDFPIETQSTVIRIGKRLWSPFFGFHLAYHLLWSCRENVQRNMIVRMYDVSGMLKQLERSITVQFECVVTMLQGKGLVMISTQLPMAVALPSKQISFSTVVQLESGQRLVTVATTNLPLEEDSDFCVVIVGENVEVQFQVRVFQATLRPTLLQQERLHQLKKMSALPIPKNCGDPLQNLVCWECRKRKGIERFSEEEKHQNLLARCTECVARVRAPVSEQFPLSFVRRRVSEQKVCLVLNPLGGVAKLQDSVGLLSQPQQDHDVASSSALRIPNLFQCKMCKIVGGRFTFSKAQMKKGEDRKCKVCCQVINNVVV